MSGGIVRWSFFMLGPSFGVIIFVRSMKIGVVIFVAEVFGVVIVLEEGLGVLPPRSGRC